MLFALFVNSLKSTVAACSFSGSFAATGAGPTVTSSTRTVTVPPGNTGQITIQKTAESGSVAFEYQKNGGAWTAAEPDPTVTFANGDTLALRITGATSGEGVTFDLYDVTTAANIVSGVTIEVP